MGKKIRVSENQLQSVIKHKLTEYGRKGLWKPEWEKEDQILAMYNALYGIEEFGMSKAEVAEKIIGTSVDSFNQQTSNFHFRHTGEGLDRPHPLQDQVYDEFKDMPKADFKRICQEIIDHRIENPPESVTKKQLGTEIGNKRDEIEKGRKDGFEKIGKKFDPEKHKLIGYREINPPIEDERPATVISTKEDVKSFLDDIINQINNAQSPEDVKSLADDIEFIREYIDAEWMVPETEDMINETYNLFLKKTISEIPRIKQIMGL